MQKWIAVTPETMPEDRIRVYAAYGTVLVQDCFYGLGKIGVIGILADKRLWRYTWDESPLIFVPQWWMPFFIPKIPTVDKMTLVLQGQS